MDGPTAWEILGSELERAVGPQRSPFHLVSIATIGLDDYPHNRTVVVRKFLKDAREVWFHTDSRSDKVEELRKNARVQLHWYDPASRCQIRMKAKATVHHLDEIARTQWDLSLPMSRACYTTPWGPGSPIPGAFPIAPLPPEPGDDSGLARFVVVRCVFDEVDWLILRASGHQRVRFRFESGGFQMERIGP